MTAPPPKPTATPMKGVIMSEHIRLATSPRPPRIANYRPRAVALDRLRQLAAAAGVDAPAESPIPAPLAEPSMAELADAIEAARSAGKEPHRVAAVRDLVTARILAADHELTSTVGPSAALERDEQAMRDAKPAMIAEMHDRFREAVAVFEKHRETCAHVPDLSKPRQSPELRPIAAALAEVDEAEDRINAVTDLFAALFKVGPALASNGVVAQRWKVWAHPTGHQLRADDWWEACASPWRCFVNGVALELAEHGTAMHDRHNAIIAASRAVPDAHMDNKRTGTLARLRDAGGHIDFATLRAKNDRAQREAAQAQARGMWNNPTPERYGHPALP